MRYLLIALILAAMPTMAQETKPELVPMSPAAAAPQRQEDSKPYLPGYRHHNRNHSGPSPLTGDFSQFTEGKIAFLRAELAITAEQEDAFVTFVDILKSYSAGMNAHRSTMREQRREMQSENQLNLPTRLGLRIGGMEQDVQALKILQRALADFYAKLSDDQKGTADRLLAHLAR